MASSRGRLPASTWVRNGRLDGRPLLVLAHGAGAPYTSDFMQGVSRRLVARELCVARFHFPYMQRMVDEGKRRPPDGAANLLAAWRAMLASVARWKGVGTVVIGGKSMGGRMASLLLADDHEARDAVSGAVYLGYPLHPPGRPEKLRSEHLPRVGRPQLFVSGTRDSLCDLDLLGPVLKGLRRPPARLHVVEGGDHSLVVKRSDPWGASDPWLDAVADFVHAR